MRLSYHAGGCATLLALACLGLAQSAAADRSLIGWRNTVAESPSPRSEKALPAGIDAVALYAALVRVQSVAVPNARSTTMFGREREGTGTVIGEDGLILTIGYLVMEAADITVIDSQGRSYPAELVAVDHTTELGLIRTTIPLKVTPAPLGNSSKLAIREPLLIAGWGGLPDTALAYIVSRRPFTANSEYMLDEAIFTSPPTTGWSGAALVDRRGTIVGVGSLLLREATTADPRLPGNMFVPIDALRPVLDDLVKKGRRGASPRPWIGVAIEEVLGRLIVSGVMADSPAEDAGVRSGDVVVAIGDEAVKTRAEFYQKLWSGTRAGDLIEVKLLQNSDIRDISIKSISRAQYFRKSTAH